MIDLPVCIFCGALTNDWWLLDGKTNTCRCHACYENGIAETDFEIAFFAQFPPAPVTDQDTSKKLPSPTPSFNLSIWKLHIAEGSERLRKWANEQARKRGYR